MTEVTEVKFVDFYHEKLATKCDFIKKISTELIEIVEVLGLAGLAKKFPQLDEIKKGSELIHLTYKSMYSTCQFQLEMNAAISLENMENTEELINKLYKITVEEKELFIKLLNTLKNESMETAQTVARMYDYLITKIV